VPDFNAAIGELGQVLLNPPTVAGWAQGRAWITPGTLLARGNFAREAVLPNMIDFVDPNLIPDPPTRRTNARILSGMDISAATSDRDSATADAAKDKTMIGEKAVANLLSEQEEFNTRYASLKGWQEAVRKIKPIPRAPAQFSLAEMVFAEEAETTAGAVDRLLLRFLSVPVDANARAALIAFLDDQLGTSDLVRAKSYLEEPLRLVAHLIMSAPEYQLA
jgi:uncharacterized protein (DUF1800 family)